MSHLTPHPVTGTPNGRVLPHVTVNGNRGSDIQFSPNTRQLAAVATGTGIPRFYYPWMTAAPAATDNSSNSNADSSQQQQDAATHDAKGTPFFASNSHDPILPTRLDGKPDVAMKTLRMKYSRCGTYIAFAGDNRTQEGGPNGAISKPIEIYSSSFGMRVASLTSHRHQVVALDWTTRRTGTCDASPVLVSGGGQTLGGAGDNMICVWGRQDELNDEQRRRACGSYTIDSAPGQWRLLQTITTEPHAHTDTLFMLLVLNYNGGLLSGDYGGSLCYWPPRVSGAAAAVSADSSASDHSAEEEPLFDDSRLVVVVKHGRNPIMAAAQSPCGSFLVTGHNTSNALKLWDTASILDRAASADKNQHPGRLLATSPPCDGWIRHASFSHDGKFIFCCGFDGRIYELDALSLARNEEATLDPTARPRRGNTDDDGDNNNNDDSSNSRISNGDRSLCAASHSKCGTMFAAIDAQGSIWLYRIVL